MPDPRTAIFFCVNMQFNRVVVLPERFSIPVTVIDLCSDRENGLLTRESGFVSRSWNHVVSSACDRSLSFPERRLVREYLHLEAVAFSVPVQKLDRTNSGRRIAFETSAERGHQKREGSEEGAAGRHARERSRLEEICFDSLG